ncbi:MAG: carboxylesterase family protein [bacterium]|nr:carboxylesterase family protein [bacterium]
MPAVVSTACSSQTVDPRPVAAPDARRIVAEGALLGGDDLYESHSWLGIPYAAAPVGELRWKAPGPPADWSGERDATRFTPACTQLASPLGGAADLPMGAVRGSEDCLSLNVYAPRFSAANIPKGSGRLPVIVYIHGGSNRSGSGDFYHGGNLAATQQLIVVTLNYRLGPLGWFYHPALAKTAASPNEASGNFALLDLIAALQWLRTNAPAFGGDPNRITIMGESAGANNVLSLLLSPAARGLFHRAIMQSALPGFSSRTQAATTHENAAEKIMHRLLVAEGKAPTLAAAASFAKASPPAELARFLRSLSTKRVIDAYRDNLQGENDARPYYALPTLIQDGRVLPVGDLRKQLQAGGSATRVPLLIGANRDEENLYLAIDDRYMKRYFGLLPVISEPVFYDAIGDHLSSAWRILGLHRPARAIRAVNPRVFAYRFDWDEEPTIFGTDLGLALGAAHAFEVPFAFGHFRLGAADRYMFTGENLPGRLELSGAMMSYWAQFARTGNPGRGSSSENPQTAWPPYGSDEQVLLLDTPADGGRRVGDAGPLTRDALFEAVREDTRLGPDDRRCRVYRRMVEQNRLLQSAELASFGCQ